MKTNYEIRYAAHPEDAKNYDTKRIRRDFLIEKVFAADEVNMVYSMYDRMVVGGAMPVNEELKLEAIDPLKADYFTTRREIGIFNVGEGEGVVKVGDETFTLGFKEALYIGRAIATCSSAARTRRSRLSSTLTVQQPTRSILARRLQRPMPLLPTWVRSR